MTDRLSRFTPNPAGLDRDALLFAAGQQSARRSRLWPVLAGLLAVSQAVTLVVLWPTEPPATVIAPPVPTTPVTPSPIERVAPLVSPDPDVWSVGTSLDAIQVSPRPVSAGEYVSSGPPLSAGSRRYLE